MEEYGLEATVYFPRSRAGEVKEGDWIGFLTLCDILKSKKIEYRVRPYGLTFASAGRKYEPVLRLQGEKGAWQDFTLEDVARASVLRVDKEIILKSLWKGDKDE